MLRIAPPSARIALLFSAAIAAVLGLGSCAAATDPHVTRDSIAEVSAEPEAEVIDAINEEYSAELHPEPFAEARECSRYLVITARGTGEPQKGQLLSPVARTIAEARPTGVDVLDLDYPADAEVRSGGTRGVRTLIDTLNVQAEACPGQEFVLLGYSQGAMVVGDALTAAEDRMLGLTAGAVDADARARIRAVVLYGDPRFNAVEEFNIGDYLPDTDGLVPRPTGALADLEDRVRDYCVALDMVCQSSFHATEEAHLEYFSNGMQADGAAYVITLLDPLEAAMRDSAPSSEHPDSEPADPPASDPAD